jgi:hypothetical protein
MRYLVSVIDDTSNPGSTDRQPAISAFNERLIAGGYWVVAGSRTPTRPRSSATEASRRCPRAGRDLDGPARLGAPLRRARRWRRVSALFLSVGVPPATHEEAPAAAEHFAFCPDNIWQGHEPNLLAAYAERLADDDTRTFWWD